MSVKSEKTAKLAACKLALAKKYERLVKVSHSKPRRETWTRLSAKYQRQYETLLRA